MKILLLTACLIALPGGDRERGLQLYRDGKFAEAAAAFRLAVAADPDSAETQWNLALACWRAGDLAAAEVAAEKYAALAEDARPELHRGLLGAVRFAEAQQFEGRADAAIDAASAPAMPAPAAGGDDEPVDPLPLLEQALQKAVQAKNYFVRGARAKPTPELLRNTERSLRKIDELKRRIEEMLKQREQQQEEGDKQQDDQQPKPDGEEDKDQKSDQNDKQQPDQKQEGDKKEGDQNDPGESKQGDPKQEPSQQGEEPGESKPGEGESPEPSPDKPDKPQQSPNEAKNGEANEAGQAEGKPEPGQEEQQQPGDEQAPPPPEPKPGEQRTDAPGEGLEGRELSPEQAQRLIERLKELDDKLKQARSRTRRGRRPVGRDW